MARSHPFLVPYYFLNIRLLNHDMLILRHNTLEHYIFRLITTFIPELNIRHLIGIIARFNIFPGNILSLGFFVSRNPTGFGLLGAFLNF